MKICYLADAQSVHTKRWIEYFAERGHDIHLISKNKDRWSFKGVNFYYIGSSVIPSTTLLFKLIQALFAIMTIRTLVKKLSPNVLHVHYISGLALYGVLSGLRPLVVSAWGSDVLVDLKRSKARYWIVKYALKKADMVTCDAEHMKEAMAKLGADPEKIRIIHFGVNTRRFSPKPRNEKLRMKLGISDSPSVISLRNLDPLYDVASLINSVPLVLKEVPEAKFVIAGRGSQEKELKELAFSLGVSSSVKFVGFISNDDLPEYLASVDVYVSTSLSDAGIAASTAEAMACGLPVIITDFGDNRKWVKDGVNGFVIPLKDPKSLAEKIVYLLKNEGVGKKFGEANRKIIEERNDYYKEMEKMEGIYKDLIKRHER